MDALIQKMHDLGYTEIEEVSENAFLAKHGEGRVYVERVAEKELRPEVVNNVLYKAMEHPSYPQFAFVTNNASNAYLSIAEEKAIPEIPRAVTREESTLFHKRQLTKRDTWS